MFRGAVTDTARAQAQVLRAIGGSTAATGGRLCPGALSGRCRRGRNAAIGQLDDEGRPVVPRALGQPGLVVVAGCVSADENVVRPSSAARKSSSVAHVD